MRHCKVGGLWLQTAERPLLSQGTAADLLDGGNEEGESLPGAGFGLAHDVLATLACGNCCRLHIGALRVAQHLVHGPAGQGQVQLDSVNCAGMARFHW